MTPKKLLTRLALPLAAAPLAACATAGAPTAQEPDAPPSARVEVVLEDAPAPTEVARTADHSTYVVWVQDGDGDGPRRLGAMDYDAERDLAVFSGGVPASEFDLIVTAEENARAESPSAFVMTRADCDAELVAPRTLDTQTRPNVAQGTNVSAETGRTQRAIVECEVEL
ncbi:MAG TPA: hypothetical protein RMH85_32555 [Polyangiaceae bacterium LLY-WYZ-15_(1-7)]|nr:hypothetical protein [Myxococcales bacterium]MBJ69822.1 hypothetical protein [Sandaracinus sp.]HJK89467.1 hypothetical protein [Polyangiaceae bacterium LLY-WYZ-15_(1-7)]HJL02179.1 hypothetical protein [Polyangiaceae bacterium LLY-WYZ-15_(1-7)]HJL13259.1 hypothetical protein [Polyangiaceae bacterium LLY-WYZ-15_(1-7)]